AMARALAVEPRFLLLDEPFSMLDSLTRFELQDTLLQVWERRRRTVVMVTHDIDEALYLADRLILMTDGPEAGVGEILEVPFARPRRRAAVLAHPEYYACRRRVLESLDHHAHQSRTTSIYSILRRSTPSPFRPSCSCRSRRPAARTRARRRFHPSAPTAYSPS